MKKFQIFFLCPVPEDQKPISQYLAFKEKQFEKKNFPFLFLSLGLCFFFPILLFFLFLFLGIYLFSIFQVEERLIQSRFLYEEGSWYDTQIWEKPMRIIKADRFLAFQKPILPIFFLF